MHLRTRTQMKSKCEALSDTLFINETVFLIKQKNRLMDLSDWMNTLLPSQGDKNMLFNNKQVFELKKDTKYTAFPP